LTRKVRIKRPKFQDPRRFFIIYNKDTGWDYAKHIHDGLHKLGVNTFLDTEDIEEGLSKPEWRAQRDAAIENADVFVFIVTVGASRSNEVKYELKKAKEDEGKEIKAFVHVHVWNIKPETIIYIDGKRINVMKFQVSKFRSEFELLREVVRSASIVRALKF
jgi:hypothetical protein